MDFCIMDKCHMGNSGMCGCVARSSRCRKEIWAIFMHWQEPLWIYMLKRKTLLHGPAGYTTPPQLFTVLLHRALPPIDHRVFPPTMLHILPAILKIRMVSGLPWIFIVLAIKLYMLSMAM